MTERQHGEDRSGAFIQGVLGNKESLRIILDEKQNRPLLTRMERKFKDFDRQEISVLAGRLILGMGQENSFWNVDRRDGALVVLSQVASKVPQLEFLRDTYISAVTGQNKDADPLGTIDSLLEAGKIIAPHLPQNKETWYAIRKAWKDVGSAMQGNPYWDAVSEKVEEIGSSMSPQVRRGDTVVVEKDQQPQVLLTEDVEIPGSTPEIKQRRRTIAQEWLNGKQIAVIAQELKVRKSKVFNDVFVLKDQGILDGRMRSAKEITSNDIKLIA